MAPALGGTALPACDDEDIEVGGVALLGALLTELEGDL